MTKVNDDRPDCRYMTGKCHDEGVLPDSDPVMCLECLASGFSNHVVMLQHLINTTSVPYPVAEQMVHIFRWNNQLHGGFAKWTLEHSAHGLRKAGILEALEQQRQDKVGMAYLMRVSGRPDKPTDA